MGVFVPVTVAWMLGILLLPIAAGVLGIPLRSGIVCLFGCTAYLRDDQPLSGVLAYGQLVVASVVTGPALAVPAVLFWFFRREGKFIVRSLPSSLHTRWSTGSASSL